MPDFTPSQERAYSPSQRRDVGYVVGLIADLIHCAQV